MFLKEPAIFMTRQAMIGICLAGALVVGGVGYAAWYWNGLNERLVPPKTDVAPVVPTVNPQQKGDLIRVSSPLANAVIASPLRVTGEARGTWFFEASFPVRVVDANGTVLGTGIAQAQSEWMTDAYVPFVADVIFTNASTQTGEIVLQKDNPSGLPEHEDEFRLPIVFSTTTQAIKLYYYDATKDSDASGNILCSRQGLVAVERQIPLTKTPIQDAIRQLLKGDLTLQERAQGLSTEYPLSGVTLKGAALHTDGVLTLEFTDPENKTSGGSCRAGILWFQVEATAKQFAGVKEVRFIPEDLFQP